jgi:hypothetical protein
MNAVENRKIFTQIGNQNQISRFSTRSLITVLSYSGSSYIRSQRNFPSLHWRPMSELTSDRKIAKVHETLQKEVMTASQWCHSKTM